MPVPTPFHKRTSALCASLKWSVWEDQFTVLSYDFSHEPEYLALRHAAGLIDVTPLYKYRVTGKDAAAFLDMVMAKQVSRLKVGKVAYCCWCNDAGRVVDDGTIFRLDPDRFRVAAAEPMLGWFLPLTRGFDVSIQDESRTLAVASLQGPTSRSILSKAADGDVENLPYFGVMASKIGQSPVWISRTGYTGSLGYEIWVENSHAIAVWDALMEAGGDYDLIPAGLNAMDVARVEAGLIMNGVEFFNAEKCLLFRQTSSPYELGLGWAVDLNRGPFVGQKALMAEKRNGSREVVVGLEVDWDEYEALYRRHGLPAHVPGTAWRCGVPVYGPAGCQIGKATSGVWSPILKKNLAMGFVEPKYSAMGTKVKMEITVEYSRHKATARVVKMPFLNFPEKRR